MIRRNRHNFNTELKNATSKSGKVPAARRKRPTLDDASQLVFGWCRNDVLRIDAYIREGSEYRSRHPDPVIDHEALQHLLYGRFEHRVGWIYYGSASRYLRPEDHPFGGRVEVPGSSSIADLVEAGGIAERHGLNGREFVEKMLHEWDSTEFRNVHVPEGRRRRRVA